MKPFSQVFQNANDIAKTLDISNMKSAELREHIALVARNMIRVEEMFNRTIAEIS